LRLGQNDVLISHENVEFHRELTRVGRTFPLRFDPCSNLPSAVSSGGSWSDRHGVIERDPALGFPG
jgi:hypothetical protein